jgi:hypothetical protein
MQAGEPEIELPTGVELLAVQATGNVVHEIVK